MTQSVTDRSGNSIYLTDERWRHIMDDDNHPEMDGYRDRVLDVLRRGRRRYDDLNPNNMIVVIVKFGFDIEGRPNNFVLTSYQVYEH